MCGRVRLGTDFSQIRIKLKFDQAAPVPNVPASWNVCPRSDAVAVGEDGKRIPRQKCGGGSCPDGHKIGFSSIGSERGKDTRLS
jgi:hypothetical protein